MRTAALLAAVLFVALFEFGYAGDCDSKSSEENNDKQQCSQKCQTSSHDKNVQEIERKKREHEENVKIIKEKERTHEKNVRIIKEKEKEHEENVRKYVKAQYCRKSQEKDKEYFQRICKKEDKSNEEYVKRMREIYSCYSNLDLWYEEEYLCYTRSYYTQVYSRKSCESEEQYYSRLVAKESYEDDSNWARRVNVLRVLYPGLSVWYTDRNFNKYTRRYYETYYQLKQGETCQDYIKRVFKKAPGEDDENYWRRVKLVQRCHSECKCWKNKKYFKDVGVCSCILEAKNEEELRTRIEAEKSGNTCKKSKLEAVKGFFKNMFSKDDSSSSSSEGN